MTMHRVITAFEERALTALRETEKNLIFWGPPGRSKTHSIYEEAERRGKTIYASAVTKQKSGQGEIAYLNRVEGEGGFRWHLGLGLRAWTEGAWLVWNDVHNAGPDMLSALYQLSERIGSRSARIDLPNGKIMQPEPGFRMFLTMNEDPQVRFGGNEAILSRFPIRIKFEKAPSWAITGLKPHLQGLSHTYDLRLLYDLQDCLETLPPEKACALFLGPAEAQDLTNAIYLAQSGMVASDTPTK